MGETWEDGESCEEQNYEVRYVHEFRYEYDQPRARYMEATRDCEDPEDVVDTVWTDYLGGTVYGDFTVVEVEGSPVYTDLNAFLPGIGRVDPHGTSSAVEYYHSNQIGTTRAMTDDGGDDEQGVVYTAFGERIDGTDHRYGYAGAWGYRSHDDFACDAESPEYEFPYLHVGWRYYDPASGRFLQRNPIGIYGGLNVYEYVYSTPSCLIDPTGLANDWGISGPFPPGWRPASSPYGPPKRPPGPKSKPKKPLSTAEELERTKKKIFFLSCATGLGGAATGAVVGAGIGGPVGAAVGAIVGVVAGEGGHIVDEIIHIDEPLNPVHGGSYEAG